MAKTIRSIKADLCDDETLGHLTRDARLLFVGLITRADDYGRFRANPSLVRSRVFPYDADITPERVQSLLNELADAGRVHLYDADGQRYGLLPNWAKHQRVDNAARSEIPDPPRSAANRRKSRRTSAGGGGKGGGLAAAPNGDQEDPPLEGIGGDRRGEDPAAAEADGGEVIQHAAHRLTADFWEASNPKPTTKFIALRKLVERFLEAGWPEAAVADGLRRTKAFTLAGIEFTLRAHHRQAEPAAWDAIRAAMGEPA